VIRGKPKSGVGGGTITLDDLLEWRDTETTGKTEFLYFLLGVLGVLAFIPFSSCRRWTRAPKTIPIYRSSA
jgi:hypothetical protein